jgi:hypothetical protein
MKSIRINIIFLGLIALLSSSCIKNELINFEGTTLEFDAATYNAKSSGQVYPLLTRVPGYGRATRTSAVAATTLSPAAPADPLLTRASGLVKYRVNLVGPQRNEALTVNYRVVATGTTAVSGTHYTTGTSLVIPANSSFGELEIQIVNPGVSSATPVILILELIDSNGVIPSQNFKTIAVSIAQT